MSSNPVQYVYCYSKGYDRVIAIQRRNSAHTFVNPWPVTAVKLCVVLEKLIQDKRASIGLRSFGWLALVDQQTT